MTLSCDEYGRLAHKVVAEPWRPLLDFLVASRCRWGEAAALKPGDADQAAGTVLIRRAELALRCARIGAPAVLGQQQSVSAVMDSGLYAGLMDPASIPYGPAAGTVPTGPPVSPVGPAGYGWQYALPARRGNRLLTASLVITAVIAVAALAVGINALATRSAPAPAAPSASPSATSAGDTRAADGALCTAIGPLMAENDQTNNAYVKSGDAGTPARDAATPKFISDTLNWIGRALPILDQHPDVDPFFHRSLQRFIDDQHLLVLDLTPGPLTSYAKTLFSDSVGAYSGPLHICDGLGIKW